MALATTDMSQVVENPARNKSGSRSTVVVSMAALGSVIAASSCCLPLLPFVFAAGAAGTSAFFAQLRPYLLEVPASQTVQLQAEQDQQIYFVVLGDCGVCINLLPTGDRQPGG